VSQKVGEEETEVRKGQVGEEEDEMQEGQSMKKTKGEWKVPDTYEFTQRKYYSRKASPSRSPVEETWITIILSFLPRVPFPSLPHAISIFSTYAGGGFGTSHLATPYLNPSLSRLAPRLSSLSCHACSLLLSIFLSRPFRHP